MDVSASLPLCPRLKQGKAASPTGPPHLNRLLMSRLESDITKVLMFSVSHFGFQGRIRVVAPVLAGKMWPPRRRPLPTRNAPSIKMRIAGVSRSRLASFGSLLVGARTECGSAAGSVPPASPSYPTAGPARPSIHRVAGQFRRGCARTGLRSRLRHPSRPRHPANLPDPPFASALDKISGQ